MTSLIRTLAATAWLLLAATSVQSQSLSLLRGEVSVQTHGPGLPISLVRDPWLAEVTASTSYGRASLSGGLSQASAEWLPGYTGSASQITYLATDISLQNTGSSPLTPGPISVLFDATMAQFFGADGFGLSHFTIGILSASLGGTLQSARADHFYNARSLGGVFSDDLRAAPSGQGGGVASIFTATPGSFEAGLTLPGFTLAPGAVLRVLFSLQVGALGSGNWGALVDATQSAQLSMQLPQGVTVISDQPLAWISAVPEPASAALLAIGLTILALAATRRRRA